MCPGFRGKPCATHEKNDLKLWQVKTWCIPPTANADCVYYMEDELRVYQLPSDQCSPVVCMDEASKQLIGEVNTPLPRRGWRHSRITARRTKRDWAACIRELVDMHYPQATRMRLVIENLNTHTGSSLYEAFPPAEARRLLDRLAFHHIPKHASWLCRKFCLGAHAGILAPVCMGIT